MSDLGNRLEKAINANDLSKLNEEMLLSAKRELYKRRYFEFFKKAVTILEPETDWVFNWHIEMACDYIQEEVENVFNKKKVKHTGYVFNLPPGSSKSMIFSICLVGWVWSKYPWAKIAGNSYDLTLSMDHCVKSRDLIRTDWYQELFGHVYELRKDLDSKKVYSNSFGGERKVNAQTGKHFDIIICDDLQNPKLVRSEAYRTQTNDLFFKTLPSRFRNLKFKSLVVVMQRLHILDICAEIEKRELNYKRFIVPAQKLQSAQPFEILEKYEEDSFWNTRFPINILLDKRDELGSVEFNCQYNQTPAKRDGMLLNLDWFRIIPYDKFLNIYNETTIVHKGNASKIDTKMTITMKDNYIVHFVLDTAYADKKDQGDYSAIIAFTVLNRQLYVLNSVKFRKKFNDLITFTESWVRRNGYTSKSRLWVENVAGGKYVKQTLIDNTDLSVIPIPEKITMMGKKNRALECVGRFESGRVILVEHGDLDELTHQIATFTLDKDGQDDLFDCLLYSVKLYLIKNTAESFKIHFI